MITDRPSGPGILPVFNCFKAYSVSSIEIGRSKSVASVMVSGDGQYCDRNSLISCMRSVVATDGSSGGGGCTVVKNNVQIGLQCLQRRPLRCQRDL